MKYLLMLILIACPVAVSASVDLDMFRLSGCVDSISVSNDDAGLTWQTEFYFDEEGRLVEMDGYEPSVTRGQDGRISTFTILIEDEDSQTASIETQLVYDDAGRVVKTISVSADERWTETYSYDPQGRLKERKYNCVEEDDRFVYTYLKTDPQGNWTERVEKSDLSGQSIRQTRYIRYCTQ